MMSRSAQASGALEDDKEVVGGDYVAPVWIRASVEEELH
jgi:hypothetical protein